MKPNTRKKATAKHNTEKHPEWVTVRYASRHIIEYSEAKLKQMINAGEINAKQEGGKTSPYLIERDSIYRYINALD